MDAVVTLKLTVAELNLIVFALNGAISSEQSFRTTTNAQGVSRKESFEREAQFTAIRDKLR